ncbi:hypothetical protein HYDPIDRAFT_165828 [Hydnomerulius pinastri MD-312]|nr:hypothetical protein HYDPIDRAFT_165828 [Hydnomerulius pinastri MD-312]
MQFGKVWFSLLALAACALAVEQPTELIIETTYMPEDCPVKAAKGDMIAVHYTGTLFDGGAKFDSSLDRGPPINFQLLLTLTYIVPVGVGQVIRGWDDGLLGMCVGEKRTLTIPARLAYGNRGAGKAIPPHSGLVFTTELVSLEPAKRDEL